MKYAIALAAALVIAAPGQAQSVRAGVEAWQKGEPAAAVAIWKPLAVKGDADAAFNLGQAYRLGKGVAVDLGRAQQYFEQAARTGHVDAATSLGILLFQNGNRTGAVRWLKKAAEAGEARAMLLYGTALYNGDGTAPDPIRAYAFISRAAAQGLDAGRATLADLDASMPLDERRKGIEMARAMVGKPAAPPAVAPKPAVTKTPEPAPVRATPQAAAPAGNWRIQLGAFGQRSAAEALFGRLRARLGPRQPYYVSAGPVVRLQVGPYASRAAAAAACAGLGGQACFAVRAR